MQASKQTRKDENFKEFNSFVYHTFWTLFLKPLKKCYDEGGIETTVAGVTRHLLPVIAFFIQDAPEGALLSGTKLGAQVKSPCRVCWVKNEDCNQPYANAPLRTENEMRQLVEPLLQSKNIGT